MNKDTYFVCPQCGTVYRYLLEPVTAAAAPAAAACGGSGCCEKHPFAPICDHCGTAMLVTNSSDVAVFLRDALRKIWEGETS